MYVPFGPFWASISEILPTNVLAGAMALINSFGALGAFVGTKAVGYLPGVTKGYGASYLLMAISLLLAAILTVIAFKHPSRIDQTKNNNRTIEPNTVDGLMV